MKKILVYIVLCCMMAGLLSGCLRETESNEQPAAVRVGALTGPTAICMSKMLSDGETGISLYGSADELVPLILQGEIDIASVPLNLASVLYNKTKGGVTLLAVNVLGVLYIGEYNSDTLHGISDLRGQTLYATGKGAVPEIYLRYTLTHNGIDPDSDVNIEWKNEPGEIIALLNAKQSGIAMLPQPYATAAAMQLGEGFHTVISLSEEWDALNCGGRCITAGVIVRNEFLSQQPELTANFLKALEESVRWTNENPAMSAAVCESLGFAKAAVIEKAIPLCNLVCITGDDMKTAVSDCLKIQLDFDGATVGGALPDDNFYYDNRNEK